MKEWKAQNQDNAEYIGVVEFQDNSEEYHIFEIVKNDTHLIFGSTTNTGLLESGNYEIDPDFSIDENIQELISDLESFFNDGDGFQTDRFTHNDRM